MPFYRTWRFWESVVASCVAALLLWLLSKLLQPIGPLVTAMGWEGFPAWFGNLGWFLFVMTLAVWWVNRRHNLQRPLDLQPSTGLTMAPVDREARSLSSLSTAQSFEVLQAFPERGANQQLVYPLKFKIQMKNRVGEPLEIYNPRWIRAPDRWPPQPPSIVKFKPSPNAKDCDSLKLAADQDAFVWVGLDKALSEDEIRIRREQRRLGAIEFTAQRDDGSEMQIRVDL
jgi:hypothetical protein